METIIFCKQLCGQQISWLIHIYSFKRLMKIWIYLFPYSSNFITFNNQQIVKTHSHPHQLPLWHHSDLGDAPGSWSVIHHHIMWNYHNGMAQRWQFRYQHISHTDFDNIKALLFVCREKNQRSTRIFISVYIVYNIFVALLNLTLLKKSYPI